MVNVSVHDDIATVVLLEDCVSVEAVPDIKIVEKIFLAMTPTTIESDGAGNVCVTF